MRKSIGPYRTAAKFLTAMMMVLFIFVLYIDLENTFQFYVYVR